MPDPYEGDPVPMSDRLDAVSAALDGIKNRFDANLAEDLRRAHEAGKSAARDGRDRKDCPYAADEMRASWAEGYDGR